MQIPNKRYWQSQKDEISGDVGNGLNVEDLINIHGAIASRWLVIPEEMNWPAREYEETLEDYQPHDCHSTKEVERSLKPDYRRHSGGVFGEDAFVVEKDGELDHGDCGTVEVFEQEQDEVPVFYSSGPGDIDVFTEASTNSWFAHQVNYPCCLRWKDRSTYLRS